MKISVSITRADGSHFEEPFGAKGLRLPAQGGSTYRLTDADNPGARHEVIVRRIGDNLVIDLVDGSGELVIEQWFFVCDVDYRGCAIELDSLGGAPQSTLSPTAGSGTPLADGTKLIWATPPAKPALAAVAIGDAETNADARGGAGAGTAIPEPWFSDSSSTWKPVLGGVAGLLVAGAVAGGGSSGTDAGQNAGGAGAGADAGAGILPGRSAAILTASSDAPAATDAKGDPIAPGPLANGARTNDASPTLAGTIDSPLGDGERVQILRDGQVVGEAKVTAGEWRFTDNDVPQGRRQYSARVIDSNGNRSDAGEPWVLDIDGTAPVAPLIDAVTGDGIVSPGELAAGFTVSGSAEAGSTIVLRWGELQLNGATDATGRFAIAIAPASAVGTGDALQVAAVDEFGNRSTDATQPVTVVGASGVGISGGFDDVARVTGRFDDGARINDATPVLTGVLTQPLADGERVQVMRGGVVRGEAQTAGLTWTFQELSLREGDYTTTVRIVDRNGNVIAESVAPLRFVVDLSEPERPVIDAVEGNNRITGREADDGVQVTGEAEANAAIEVTWGNTTRATTADGRGEWSVEFDRLPVGNGSSRIEVIAIDAAGNVSDVRTRSVTVTVAQSDDDALNAAALGSAQDSTVLQTADILDSGESTIAGLPVEASPVDSALPNTADTTSVDAATATYVGQIDHGSLAVNLIPDQAFWQGNGGF